MSDKQVLCPLVEEMRRARKNCMRAWSTGEVIAAERADDWADELELWLQKVEKLVEAGQAMRDCNYINTKNSMAWDAALKELRTP